MISLLITFFFFLEVRGNQAGFPTRGEPDEGMILCENNNLNDEAPTYGYVDQKDEKELNELGLDKEISSNDIERIGIVFSRRSCKFYLY